MCKPMHSKPRYSINTEMTHEPTKSTVTIKQEDKKSMEKMQETLSVGA